ncbi:hypothetical protein GCM10025878_06120 [Leuconostoc gasicomitatum]|uniref:hypothetical protein n=1 Tax=Leuconostoc TaxID=1243 RepID=UPI0005A1A9C3|nr:MULTISPECIES: hypothetical protein [Leuconostoc]MBZ5947578.1 hypothetical protein [Leuconostoc gasicomitatum]MBZ5957108.1 hypothetical protein [Leuconostoc gasicomitatum]MBZ5958494.1 hypothetical protein [Leuconostoc gasicomitatum]MBZ5960396.1 hypothetical protein [Leuconostoc gasicomitatum]MBZ5965458.1 hypothetical protein [Leuconostoc gasicomitatum]
MSYKLILLIFFIYFVNSKTYKNSKFALTIAAYRGYVLILIGLSWLIYVVCNTWGNEMFILPVGFILIGLIAMIINRKLKKIVK